MRCPWVYGAYSSEVTYREKLARYVLVIINLYYVLMDPKYCVQWYKTNRTKLILVLMRIYSRQVMSVFLGVMFYLVYWRFGQSIPLWYSYFHSDQVIRERFLLLTVPRPDFPLLPPQWDWISHFSLLQLIKAHSSALRKERKLKWLKHFSVLLFTEVLYLYKEHSIKLKNMMFQ